MKSNSGTAFSYSLFGESHGAAIGITVNNLPAGFQINLAEIDEVLALRQGGAKFNTARQEKPEYEIVSGLFEGKLTGTPLTVLFYNRSTKSKDYDALKQHPRPGHADYVAKVKYHEANDHRGGGHFSGRITTPLVFLGEICQQILKKQYPKFAIYSHIQRFGPYQDSGYYQLRKNAIRSVFNLTTEDLPELKTLKAHYPETTISQKVNEVTQNIKHQFSTVDKKFPVLTEEQKSIMEAYALKAKKEHDTLGGQLETVVFNPPLALGEPFFDSVESVLSHLLFSIGSIKGVTFGLGTDFAQSLGSEVKDEIISVDTAGGIQTLCNYNGGINGGITNGEDIVIQTTLKPIASLFQKQTTYNLASKMVETLQIQGRHDSTIVNRVIPVIEAVIAIGLYDLFLQKKMEDC